MNFRLILLVTALGVSLALFVGCGDDDKSTGPTGGIYAEILLDRWVNSGAPGGPDHIDDMSARLDSSYAPDGPIQPIESAIMTFQDDTLIWSPYNYNFFLPCLDFCHIFELGENYTFEIIADDQVSALSRTITFLTGTPRITYPDWQEYLPLGHDVQITWINSGSGTVDIIFEQSMNEIYTVTVPNTGAYAVPWDKISVITAGPAYIYINHYNRKAINASGYDSRSFIEAHSRTYVYIEFHN